MPFCNLRIVAPRPRTLPRGYPLKVNTLGHHLRRRRLDLGQTQRTLARTFGVREETVGIWGQGLAKPLPRHYRGIVQFLGYEPEPVGDGLLARLLAARRRLGLTVAQFAARSGFDEGSICRWTIGNRTPSSWMVGRIRAALAELEGKTNAGAEPASFLALTRWRRRPSTGALPETFGERLRARRLELGLSQTEAGKQFGVGRGTVRRWERGDCRPARARDPAVARFLLRTSRDDGWGSSR